MSGSARAGGDRRAGVPCGEVAVPDAIADLADGRPVVPVWRNQLGGLTCRLGVDADAHIVKWNPHGNGIDLGAEAARLRWAARWIRVPEVVAEGADADASWLVTRAIDAENAVAPRWKAEPARAVRILGRGLRILHDALPVGSCPFSWRTTDRLAVARDRAAAGLIDADRIRRDHAVDGVDDALEQLTEPPPADIVVGHGDACAPNTLIAADGELAGHVDLGTLGVGDRWADLAVATWSTVWNYGPGWENALLAAYGIDPDPDRTAYFRLLWDLGP